MKINISAALLFTLILIGISQITPSDLGLGQELTLFFGRFHPLILHIPIGALVGVLIIEIANLFSPKLKSGHTAHLLLWFSVISIIPAIVAGLLLGSSGEYDLDLLQKHKNLGLATAFISIWLLVLRQWMHKKEKGIVPWTYRILLFIAIIIISITGHHGGSLTHGSDYLTQYLPTQLKDYFGIEKTESEQIAESIKNQIEEELNQLTNNTETNSTTLAKKKHQAMEYVNHIQPLMTKYCYDCHGPSKQKAGVRLDVLNWDLINGGDAEAWHDVLDQINAGEMPPKGKPRFTDQERRAIVDWITGSLEKAVEVQQVKMSKTRSSVRRLTKAQYTNSLKELLKLDINFGKYLPEDGKSEMGFTNNASLLKISPLHIDYYQKIAREALDKAIVYGPKPKSTRYKITLGKNIDPENKGSKSGGFQSLMLKKSDFKVEILDKSGNPIYTPKTDSIINKIGIDMRGSDINRYKVEENGITLYSVLPKKEKEPKSIQGPSPNLKVIIQNQFLTQGRFKMKVEATKGKQFNFEPQNKMIPLKNRRKPISASQNRIVISPEDFKNLKNLSIKDNTLQSNSIPDSISATTTFTVDKPTFYQLDLSHPYVSAEETPAYKIQIDQSSHQQELVLSKTFEYKKEVISPISIIYLTKGEHTLNLGGNFFIGLNKINISPLPANDSYNVSISSPIKAKEDSIANPFIKTFLGTRIIRGDAYSTFDVEKEVTNKQSQFNTYDFSGFIENHYSGNNKEKKNSLILFGLWNNYLVKDKNRSGPPLLIKSIEIEAPYHETWPPKSHTNIFIDSKNKSNKEKYTEEVLSNFIEKAFRRKTTPFEVNRYLNYWKDIKEDYPVYEDGVKEVLIAILCSPNFLYMFEPEETQEKNNYLLASKLSYFLWNSPPDATLNQLASTGSLEKEMPNQIKRMVNDPKIWKMIRSFTYEWLSIDRHDNIKIDIDQYPKYSRFVKDDMVNETYHFIHHILKENLSIANFIDSKFAMLNQNLAEFYGINDIKGNNFRPVMLASNSKRGGLLTQGAFLSGHSDGTQAHTIKRAVWLKEKILGETPPPPPPNVPDLDPDTPGFEEMTLKEQLFIHRNKPSCMDCHRKIDPFGVVFENYNAVGIFKEENKGETIDVKTQLPDGTKVVGIEGIKEYILNKKKRNFTKALVEYMYAYALGRNVTFADDKEINNIVNKVAKDGYKFQSVIKHIVTSNSFLNN